MANAYFRLDEVALPPHAAEKAYYIGVKDGNKYGAIRSLFRTFCFVVFLVSLTVFLPHDLISLNDTHVSLNVLCFNVFFVCL